MCRFIAYLEPPILADGLVTKPEAILLVSEKLDREEEDWVKVPEHHVLLIDADLSFEVLGLDEIEVPQL